MSKVEEGVTITTLSCVHLSHTFDGYVLVVKYQLSTTRYGDDKLTEIKDEYTPLKVYSSLISVNLSSP